MKLFLKQFCPKMAEVLFVLLRMKFYHADQRKSTRRKVLKACFDSTAIYLHKLFIIKGILVISEYHKIFPFNKR